MVSEWASMLIEYLEKETNDKYISVREKIIYLLANAYIRLHQDDKCLIYLQLCSNPDSVPIQDLYLLYYIDKHNISSFSSISTLTID